MVRNERGRMRIGASGCASAPGWTRPASSIGRCSEIFEDFCTVGQSVGRGST